MFIKFIETMYNKDIRSILWKQKESDDMIIIGMYTGLKVVKCSDDWVFHALVNNLL